MIQSSDLFAFGPRRPVGYAGFVRRQPTPRTLRLAQLAGLGLVGLLASCSTTPTAPTRRALTVAEGDQFRIRYEAPRQTLTLQNRSSLAEQEAYAGGDQANLKIVPDDRMQWLADAFASHGFFDRARTPEREPSKSLVVECNGQSWTLPWITEDASLLKDAPCFNQCLQEFLGLYNGTTAYHTATRQDYRKLYEKRTRVNNASKSRLAEELREQNRRGGR